MRHRGRPQPAAGAKRLVALVGPSGSGKSSVVRAGLIPALRKGAIGGSDKWLVAQMVPGSHPFAEVEAALLRSSLDAPDSLAEQLADPEAGILRAAMRVLPDDRARLVLVIDQFEELFTLVDDEDQRERFLANLLTVLDDAHGRVTVVLTLRADFYDQPLAYPEFGSRMGSGVINVVPLAPDEFEAAAQGPAAQAGVTFEPALLAALLTDVVGRPGGLPLFQYTLTELFDRRVGDLLTLDSYKAIGGVGGALTKRAEDLYSQLDEAQRTAAGQLFLRLVTISEGDEWGRRRVPASEIVSLDVDLVALQSIIDLYASHRLLTLDRDYVSGSPTVEVAHEALLTEWGRLREWIAGGREDVRRYASLTAAMEEWIEAGRDTDYLLSGSRLERCEEWAGGAKLQLNAEQQRFLDSSIDARDRAAQVEEERLAAEARTARSARRRLWGMAAAVVVLVVVGVGFLVAALGPGPTRVAMIATDEFDGLHEQISVGLARAERELGVDTELLAGRFSDVEQQYRDLADSGADLIFIDHNISGRPWVSDLVNDYPDVAFAGVDSPWGYPERTMVMEFADHELAFLAGVAAALVTEARIVGYVGGAQSHNLEEWRAGFEAGVAAVDSSVEVIALYADTFSESEMASAATTVVFEAGADVVLAATGDATLGVLDAAASHRTVGEGHWTWVIAPDSDWWPLLDDRLRSHLLASAIKKWDEVIFEAIRRYETGEFSPKITTLGLADGAFALADTGGKLDATVTDQLDVATQAVVAGATTVPTVPKGVLLPPAGLEVTHAVSVTWDGSNCRHEGAPTEYSVGDVVEISFTNNSSGIGMAAVYDPVNPYVVTNFVAESGGSAIGYANLAAARAFDVVCIGDHHPAEFREKLVLGATWVVRNP